MSNRPRKAGATKGEEAKILASFECLDAPPLGFRPGAVLLSDQIEDLSKSTGLIEPLAIENLKPASYQLRIGDNYKLEGKTIALAEEGQLEIPAYSVVIIETYERLNLPRFLIGRWSITVANAYRGLLWVGGPQIDPGWVGHLFCPIYNLSNKPIILTKGDELATVDFVVTQPLAKGKSMEYERPTPADPTTRKKVVIHEYAPLYSSMKDEFERIRTADQRIKDVEDHVRQLTSVNAIILGILATAAASVIGALLAGQPDSFAGVDKMVKIGLWMIGGLLAITIAGSLVSVIRRWTK